jgi:hypothetical protein
VPKQVTVRLHVPWHAPRALGGVRNCRADTAPAQKTTIVITANNIFFTIGLCSSWKKNCVTPIFASTKRFARTYGSKKNRNKYQREDNEKISDLRSGGSIMEPPALRTLGRGQPSHSAQKESAEATISSALYVLFLQ